jgi:glycosyltransferase involved in cell wall biosynthesis
MTAAPRISVVVPTRDRPEALERCLAALARQTDPSIEIVVVDDGSRDEGAVPRVVVRVVPGARIVRGRGAGPAAARNRGVQAARGDVVCFTDDDCVPEPGWAERLAHACRDGAAAAGTTVADPSAGRSAAAAQLLTHVLQVSSLDPSTGGLGFAPTCNVGCSAAVAREVAFDASFPGAAGEDRDWCARLAQAGAALRFVPEAVVVHRPELGVRGLVRQQSRYGGGAVRFRAAVGDDRRLAGRDFYGRLVREAVAEGVPVMALVALAQAAVAAGAVGELVRRRG